MKILADKGEHYCQKEKQELKSEYESALYKEKESGFRFECILSTVASAIKKKTFKLIFNDRYKGMTEQQENVLKTFPKIKRKGNVLIKKGVDGYKNEAGDTLKALALESDSLEVSEKLSKVVPKVQSNVSKIRRTLKHDVSVILRGINKRLKVFEHYMQNLYEREYCKTRMEKWMATLFMGVKFDFNRSLLERKDSDLIQLLMNLFVKDIVVLGENGESTSFNKLKKVFQKDLKKSGCEDGGFVTKGINNYIRTGTQFGKNMGKVEEVLQEGKRVIFIMPHPGYLGALGPRYVLDKLGFHEVADKWTVVSGPRPFASKGINKGAMTMGHVLKTIPSTETTPIKTPGLRRQMQLIGVKSIKIISGKADSIDLAEGEENLALRLFGETLRGGVIGIFPEGSRTNEQGDGTLELKYCSPDVLGSFVQPGDYIVNMSQTGTENILRKGKWFPRRGVISLSLGEPEKVTKEMIINKQQTLCYNMEKVCMLPSNKEIIFPYKYNEDKNKIEKKGGCYTDGKNSDA